jgi:hypothetical protein
MMESKIVDFFFMRVHDYQNNDPNYKPKPNS